VQLRDPFLEEVGRLRRGAKMLSSRGSLLMARGRFQEAEEVFERAVAADTADALAHLNLGSIRARLGKTDQARAALERAVRLDPSQSIAYMLLGQLFARQGDPAAAERHYRTALQVDPRNDEAHLGLAAVLRHTGRCMEALRHVEQVLEITPGQVQAYLEQAMCYGQRGEDVRARAVLEAAHDVFPLHRGVRDALVRILAASPVDAARDGALALALSEKTVSEANHPATAEARAMAYAELGRYTEAIRWQETAVEAARARGETAYVEHLNRALQHYRQGRPSRTPWTSFYDEM
ncbi:MAG: tetratricopeptide repeat protein, partial [Rhodothermales bacterium]